MTLSYNLNRKKVTKIFHLLKGETTLQEEAKYNSEE